MDDSFIYHHENDGLKYVSGTVKMINGRCTVSCPEVDESSIIITNPDGYHDGLYVNGHPFYFKYFVEVDEYKSFTIKSVSNADDSVIDFQVFYEENKNE